ncbi:thiocillin family RiPP [Staphylococcus sp. GSSP0090]|nr:thiocillin family RiPP [Staphylococcus sp. GSSP0090]
MKKDEFNFEDLDLQINDFLEVEEEEEMDFHGFTTAGSFACAASWGSSASSGSSFSSAGS